MIIGATDVIGFTLEEAQKMLKVAGISICSIKVTSAPKSKSDTYFDYYRVVNVKRVDEQLVELIVCKPL